MASAEPTATPPGTIGADEPGLGVTNLLNDLAALGPLLRKAAQAEIWLDAYLISAGMNQIIDDYLHNAPYPLDEAAGLLLKAESPAARLAGRTVAAGARATRQLLAASKGARRARRWQRRVAELVDQLAEIYLSGDGDPTVLAQRCRSTAVEIESLPAALRRTLARLPACFHHFDQRPEDLELLAERFSRRGGGRGRPLLVVGVRTSGSYLAPLIAAALRRRGYRNVRVLTLRPGRALLAEERMLIREMTRGGGRVLLTDDPPVTGRSLAKAAAQLERLGVSRASIVLLLALDGPVFPAALSEFDAVLIGSQEWGVNARLAPEAVRFDLQQLLGAEFDVEAVSRLPPSEPDHTRGHRRALFAVHGRDLDDDTERELHVSVSAIGMGYLGAHQLCVARALGELVPRVFGVRDGLLYREWLPDDQRITDEQRIAAGVASYVAARRRRLGLVRDRTIAMSGERPVWEVAGFVLGATFGRAAPVARVALVDPAMRKLLHVARPSVVDGKTEPANWFVDESGAPRKVGFSDRTYWNLGLACADATFDLAGVGAFEPDGRLAKCVREAWRQESREDVEPERWLLYELAHQWGRARVDPVQEALMRRASAGSVQRYFAEAFLGDLERNVSGPLVALDIDGVLETDQVGFPALTRASATSLRALIAHGYRPVPVTGRGLEEVRGRCREYGLCAGVAEYGSVVSLDGGARTIALVDDEHAAALQAVRHRLGKRGGVCLDPAYVYGVRAYRFGADGRRTRLSASEVSDCIDVTGATGMVQAIQGAGQTDFISAAVDKGVGLRTLAQALDSEIAMAVGDTASDSPMLALAAAAFVPAHAASEAMTSGAVRLRRPYQVGLASAVGRLLGHRPGGCEECRLGPQTPERNMMLDLFSIAEAGPRGLVFGALRFAAASLCLEKVQ
jgi:hydroxymethylpyrimidine pyrophosphatase-like HAD family hydrolase/adenine/guanine phosphoribosyltransferase-like PRPP-binding protein